MKKNLLLILSLLYCGSMLSQLPFSMSPNDTIISTIPSDIYTELMIEQINNSGDTLNLGVEIVYNDVPESWDGMVCLQGVCMGIIPPVGASGQMMPLTGSLNGYVRLTVNPMGGNEMAKLRVRVYDINNPMLSDTATWIVQSSTLSLQEIDYNQTFSIYPNPTSDNINIKSSSNINRIILYDQNGRIYFSKTIKGTKNPDVNLSAFPAGIYYCKIYSGNMLIGTEKVIKHE